MNMLDNEQFESFASRRMGVTSARPKAICDDLIGARNPSNKRQAQARAT